MTSSLSYPAPPVVGPVIAGFPVFYAQLRIVAVEAVGGTFGMKVDMVVGEVVFLVTTWHYEVRVTRAVRLTKVNSQDTLT